MTALTNRLSELGFIIEAEGPSDDLYKGSRDGHTVSVYVDPDEHTIQIVKMPDDPEDHTLVATFNRYCPEMLTLLESWA